MTLGVTHIQRNARRGPRMSQGNRSELGIILKQRRVAIPLTLVELSAASQVSLSHLGRIERGERFPSVRILRKLAKPLGFLEEELLTLAGYLSPPSSAKMEDSAIGKLEPYVAALLAREPVETQRAVATILNVIKSMARSIPA